MKIFLTGATGFVGSHLARELVRQGHELSLLVRPGSQTSAAERFSGIADWLGLTSEERARISVVSGFLDQPGFGLSGDVRHRLAAETQAVVHAAGATSFSERHRLETERVNIHGLEEMLRFFRQSDAAVFHYISTAYVAGRKSGVCLETREAAVGFRNPYEETKYRAEGRVEEVCRQVERAYKIYRPSIIYGDSRSGRTFRFNALYHPVRALAYLRDLYIKDLKSGGAQSARMGISCLADGRLMMPIRIYQGPGDGLNLIPIDYCAQAFVTLMERGPENRIYHLVSPETIPLATLVEFVGRFLRVAGLNVVRGVAGEKAQRNGLELLFQRTLAVYQSYLEDSPIFSDYNTAEVLSSKDVRCPVLNYEIFSICMKYALETDWGRTLI